MNLLTPDDVVHILKAAVFLGGFDETKMNMSLAGRALADVSRRVASDDDDLAFAIALTVAALSHYKPTSLNNEVFVLYAAHELARKNAAELTLAFEDSELQAVLAADVLQESDVREFAEWVAGRLTPVGELQPPDQLALPIIHEPSRPLGPLDGVRAYIACPLTGLEPDGLAHAEGLCDAAAQALSASGISVHQPILHTHPSRQAELSPRQVHHRDLEEVITSDLLVYIASAPATGVGKELVYSERQRGLQLLLVPEDATISRLVLGTTADTEVRYYADDESLRFAVQEFLAERQPDLLNRRDTRAQRDLEVGDMHAAMVGQVSLLEQLTDEDAVSVLLTRDRIFEMLRSPSHFAGASLDEILALRHLVRRLRDAAPTPSAEGLVRFTERELAALDDAAEIQGWSDADAMDLLRSARRLKARGGTRRLSFTAPSDWIDFHKDERG